MRKKRRLGEFREFGFPVKFAFSQHLGDAERNALLNDWIILAIEANGLSFGGGGAGSEWEGFVTLNARRGSTTETHRAAVESWLKGDPRVSESRIGPLTDAWHGWWGRRIRRGLCPKCAYDLRATTGGACPECGFIKTA